MSSPGGQPQRQGSTDEPRARGELLVAGNGHYIAAMPGRRRFWLLQAGVIAITCLLCVGLSLAYGQILSGRLSDTDDYLHLVQIFHWLDGAGWWGRDLPRLNPPTGTPINWARIPDLPYAAIVWLLEPLIGRGHAAIAAAALVPPLLLLPVFIVSMTWLATPVVGRKLALLCGPLAMTSAHVFYQFSPGRADHHNWHIVLSALALGAAVRLSVHPGRREAALVAAVAFALALWVGGEALPWLMAFSLALGFVWILQGPIVLPSVIAFSLVLLVLCALAVPLAQPPGARFSVFCDEFGAFYSSLPAFMLAFWTGLWVFGRNYQNGWLRFALALACGSAAGLALLALFPECRAGPYSQLDPRLADVWLQHTSEMQSLAAFAGGKGRLVFAILGPLIATAVSIVQSFARRGAARCVWLTFTIFLAIALGIGFFHVQVLPHLFVFSVVPLIWLAGEIAGRLGWWSRVISRPTTVALLYCVVLVALPGAFSLLSAHDQGRGAASRCDISGVAAQLSDPAGLGSRMRLIAAPIDSGAELLFRTLHSVLGGPFERDVTGNLDLFDFFAAKSEEDARAIAKRRTIDLVLFCPTAIGMWLPDDPAIFLNKIKNGNLPGWLRPLPVAKDSGVSLFEVDGL